MLIIQEEFKEERKETDRKKDPARLAARMRIAAEQRDRCNRNNDLSLVLAQAMYRWEVTEE